MGRFLKHNYNKIKSMDDIQSNCERRDGCSERGREEGEEGEEGTRD